MNVKSAFFLIALIAAFASPVVAEDLAVVNGKKIPISLFNEMVKQAVEEGQTDTPELRNYVKGQLIDLEVLSQEAEKQGIGKKADVAQQIDQARKSIVARGLVLDYFEKNPVTDGDIQAEYDKQKIAAAGENEYSARHILVETEEEAKAIVARLNAGATFEELVVQSKDPGSAANGGLLEWASASVYVKPFGDALKGLKKGELTQMPIMTQYGYHVIRLEDTRAIQFPALEEVKPRIAESLRRPKFQVFLGSLRDKAKIQ